MIKITPTEFSNFTKYILDISGISLDTGKEYLLETRLSPLFSALGCTSFDQLYRIAKAEPSKEIEKKIIDAISTNETYFFRDVTPFELLQHKILPDLIDKRTRKHTLTSPVNIRFWSAANSTGQELYSIAMVIKELYLDSNKYQVSILGTDISDKAIAYASYGKYNKFEISRGLPQNRLNKYFNQAENECWRVKDELRAMVSFKKMNLMKSFAGFGKFDIIFCRNVAIYFTQETRKELYKKMASVLEPDGYLIIGATESLMNDTDLFKPHRYLRSVFYQLNS
ncbi:MAG: methyltransferase domain-containing protein [Proteobacteria bacterium]|nr:methyltransferase domain-containing protein [Pseudomonadota bacterium]